MAAPRDSFEEFEATSLFCPRCRRATPTRKKLLLVLPSGSKYDYVCPSAAPPWARRWTTTQPNSTGRSRRGRPGGHPRASGNLAPHQDVRSTVGPSTPPVVDIRNEPTSCCVADRVMQYCYYFKASFPRVVVAAGQVRPSSETVR